MLYNSLRGIGLSQATLKNTVEHQAPCSQHLRVSLQSLPVYDERQITAPAVFKEGQQSRAQGRGRNIQIPAI
eukprot:7223209-Pyramimonas_sp.AAC.1